ncbi:conserved Plasmodium protein, unknown function [Plasmodium gallinaceum]|uniref:Uncharacterized protein n=1 Tax=Plasmodium gallinaceum TaxID=5849 RepID=A0A1J1GKY6_PLAGA|nr:conserved Plasmodium protein, unknown function [Plasmodium gallinaceum]CRG93033.1 conserved Plasmodium protein, unknown function [Plasmodium gallinaceum]
MEIKKKNTITDIYNCKYKNKNVLKTINDINELINKYPRTNRELNTYIIKKNSTNDISLLKSFVFYVFTQIISILAVCLVIFCIGFLIGNHISSKSSIMNSINYNFYLSYDNGAELYMNSESNILRLDIMINFNFDYNNLFMGTLINNMLLYYYPSNDIGLVADEFCYNFEGIKKENGKISPPKTSFIKSAVSDEIFKKFLKEESLIFLNYSIKMDNNVKITYINDLLFENLFAYPIGGSDITMSPGIMQGINSINALISINYNVDDKNILDKLLDDCKKGRIYIQLHSGNNQIKTILFRFQPQTGVFLPFSIPCKIKRNTIIKNNEFRLNVIKNHKIQKSAIKNINLFIN